MSWLWFTLLHYLSPPFVELQDFYPEEEERDSGQTLVVIMLEKIGTMVVKLPGSPYPVAIAL